VIVPDINLLLYATIDGFAQHLAARTWFDSVLNGEEPVGLATPTIFGFVRIATNPRILRPAMSVEQALGAVETWLSQPHFSCLVPGPRHLEIAFRLLRALGVAANLTTDAQLAAYAIENQAELYSNDVDFGRFAELRWVNPLVG
jgi:hypothetical protein